MAEYDYPDLDWSVIKSARDAIVHPNCRYFMSLVKIPTQDGVRRVTMMPWECQMAHDLYTGKAGDRIIVLKSREIGSSTFWIKFACKFLLTHPGGNVVVAANKEDSAANLISYARTILTTLPDDCRPAISKDNSTTIALPKLNNQIKALPGTVSAGRSERGKLLICSEMAFVEKAEEYFGAVSGSLVEGSRIVIESTANTQSDLFHDMYQDPVNGYQKRFFGVWENPTHTADWYAKRRGDIKDRFLFLREYPETAEQAFTGAADAYVDPDTIAAGQTEVKIPIATRELRSGLGFVHYWKRPLVGQHYVIGADVAEGKLNTRLKPDWSNAKVLNWRTGEHVATVHTRLPDDEYAGELEKLGTEYNTAHVCVERNGPGLAVLRVLQAKGYENLYWQQSSVPGLLGTRTETRNIGWLTTAANKAPACSDLYAALKAREAGSPDAGFWDEAKSFGRQTLKGMGGAHDDQWMSFVIAWQAKQAYQPGVVAEEEGRERFRPTKSWLKSMPWSGG